MWTRRRGASCKREDSALSSSIPLGTAISANAKPRLHPKAEETLGTGMVFNVEPAIYVDGYGGVRHCDMVTVTDAGVELLTPFQCRVDELIVEGN